MHNENKILQAVIKSLKTYDVVKSGDWVNPGKVRSFLRPDHISNENLMEELSEYINKGYFEVIDEKIKITQLGIDQLI